MLLPTLISKQMCLWFRSTLRGRCWFVSANLTLDCGFWSRRNTSATTLERATFELRLLSIRLETWTGSSIWPIMRFRNMTQIMAVSQRETSFRSMKGPSFWRKLRIETSISTSCSKTRWFPKWNSLSPRCARNWTKIIGGSVLRSLDTTSWWTTCWIRGWLKWTPIRASKNQTNCLSSSYRACSTTHSNWP